MHPISIILQLANPNGKVFHTSAYTVPISAEQKLQESKDIAGLLDI
jgi:hypothetical protein